MGERNLTDFEIEKLKELDTGGKDLYGNYVALRAKRETLSELDQSRRNEDSYNAYMEKEKAVLSSLENEFDKTELATLKQKTSDPKFITEVLSKSDIGSVITNEFSNGSKAIAYKMLLRETSKYLSSQKAEINSEKKKKSFPADVGQKADIIKKEKSGSIEDAFNESLQELNL
jgi:hypothetical protein